MLEELFGYDRSRLLLSCVSNFIGTACASIEEIFGRIIRKAFSLVTEGYDRAVSGKVY